ncbi:isochorismatase family protein [Nonomuraea sp. NPDC048916]|uniref:isochorismatase family protein n=1 Tax=Nonomuraea sp. NPDC048916 TaxID=3154232 RepID=UPI0033CCBBD0
MFEHTEEIAEGRSDGDIADPAALDLYADEESLVELGAAAGSADPVGVSDPGGVREHGTTTLIIAGISTSGVVLSTVLDAADRGDEW